MEYNAGKFLAKIKDYGFKVTHSGSLQMAVIFDYEQGEENRTLTWFGSMNEGKAREITLTALKNMGYQGQEISLLNDGIQSGILDTDKDYSITIELDDYNGKKIAKIKWVNLPGQSGFEKRLDTNEVKQKLAGMDLGADIAMLFGMNKADPSSMKNSFPSPPQKTFDASSIPF